MSLKIEIVGNDEMSEDEALAGVADLAKRSYMTGVNDCIETLMKLGHEGAATLLIAAALTE